MTKSLRSNEPRLLIKTVKPHDKVSTSTVSRWLKDVIQNAGIETRIFKGHSTRSACTPKASLNSVLVEDIMKTAHWSNGGTFQKFYNSSLEVDKDSFQGAVYTSF